MLPSTSFGRVHQKCKPFVKATKKAKKLRKSNTPFRTTKGPQQNVAAQWAVLGVMGTVSPIISYFLYKPKEWMGRKYPRSRNSISELTPSQLASLNLNEYSCITSVPWSLLGAAGVGAGFFLSQIVGAVLLTSLFKLDTNNPKHLYIITNFSSIFGMLASILMIGGIWGKDALKCFIPAKDGMLLNVGKGFLYTAAIIPLIALVATLSRALIPYKEQPIIRALRNEYTSGLLFQMDLAALVVAPVAEEFFFRGVLYRSLRQKMGVPWALLVSGFIFAVFHGDISLLAPLTVAGIALGAMYEKTQSLVTPIAGHMLFNFINTHSLVYGLD